MNSSSTSSRIIVMLGPQGSGKGTQAERIAARLHIPIISLGQLFRQEIDHGTDLGKEIAGFVTRGDRVPSPIVDKIVGRRLLMPDTTQGVVLDGYPRAIDQLDELDELLARNGHALTDVVFLNVNDAESLRRLSGRWMCANFDCEAKYHAEVNLPKIAGICDRCGKKLVQRADDTPEGIKHRLELYHRDTEPLVQAYRIRGILREVDGAKSIPEVEKEVLASLGIDA